MSFKKKIRTLIEDADLSVYADRADGTFRFDGIKADSFNKYDFIRI